MVEGSALRASHCGEGMAWRVVASAAAVVRRSISPATVK